MADNTTLNTGTGGDIIATDDISGVKFQRVKIAIGADGVNDGDVSATNPIPIDGTVVVTGTVAVTDNSSSLTVDGSVTANQPASTAYKVIISDGTTDVPIDASHSDAETNTEPHIDVGAKNLLFNGSTWDRVRGDVTNGMLVNLGANNDVTVSGTVSVTQATASNLNANVTVQNASIPVTDNGGSLTVDGSVSVSNFPATQAVSATNLDIRDLTSADIVTVTGGVGQAADVKITLDSEQVAISNFPATQAVSGTVTIQDGGNVITVDGTVAATQSGTWILGANSGVDIGDVTINNASGASAVNIQDGGNSITVDGTVSVTDGLNIEGDVAHDTVDSGNPVKIGFQAESSLPAAVANGDRANGISDVFGRQLVAHVDAGMQVWKGANYVTTQTGTDIWTPSAGKKICMTYIAISSYSTTAGRVILWLGASGDTTYNAGTDQLVWAGSFAPSANAKPGAIISLPYGITAVTADHRLKITTDAAISLDVTVYGYEC